MKRNAIIGAMIVASHNVWETSWRGLITLFGWLAILKGLIRIYFTDSVGIWGQRAMDSGWAKVVCVICLILGVWLTYIGFTTM